MKKKYVIKIENEIVSGVALSDRAGTFALILLLDGGQAWLEKKDEVDLNEVNFSTATNSEFEEFVKAFVTSDKPYKLSIVTL